MGVTATRWGLGAGSPEVVNMEEKQIAEIDARIAPIFRAVDAYGDFIREHTTKDTTHLDEMMYRVIYDFCEVVIEQSGQLSARNDHLLVIISKRAGVQTKDFLKNFRLAMELNMRGAEITKQLLHIEGIDEEGSSRCPRLIQYLGLAGGVRNGAGFDFFGRC
jgi:hypothetical protein